MLRWARARRLQNKAREAPLPVAVKPEKAPVSLTFASPLAPQVKAAAAEKPGAKPFKVNFRVISGAVITALIFAGIAFIGYDGPGAGKAPAISAAVATPVSLGGSLAPVVVSGSPDQPFFQDFSDATDSRPLRALETGGPGFGFPLATLVQVPEPVLSAEVRDRDVLAFQDAGVLSFGMPQARVEMSLSADRVPDRPMPNILPDNPPAFDDFDPPAQYSRKDIGEGFGSLIKLMSGQDVRVIAEVNAVANAIELSKPLIYVHHGLGVSPETVRNVMQALAGSGYERVFQVGVPFRIGRTNVRFYHDVDLNLAKAIANTVIPLVEGPQFSEPRDFSEFSEPPQAGTIDIWLSDQA